MIHRVEKRAAEAFGVGFRYTPDRLLPGATISSSTSAATKLSDGSDATATVLSTTNNTIENLSGGVQRITASIMGGVVDQEYKVVMTHTLSNGMVFLDVFKLAIVDEPVHA